MVRVRVPGAGCRVDCTITLNLSRYSSLDCQPFYWFQFLCPYLPLWIAFSIQGDTLVIAMGSSILEAFMQRKRFFQDCLKKTSVHAEV